MVLVRAPVQLLMFFAAREKSCQETKMQEHFPPDHYEHLSTSFRLSEHSHDGRKTLETRNPSRSSSSSLWLAKLAQPSFKPYMKPSDSLLWIQPVVKVKGNMHNWVLST
jgi:hypothetical protein